MTSKIAGWLLTTVALTGALPAQAQQTGKVRRLGYLAATAGPSPFFEALKLGLRELGYVEGKNLVVDFRASDDRAQVSEFAAELVKNKVEVIVAQGPAARVAGQATSTIPIVFGFSGDPVEAGLIESLAHPGKNLTGMTFLALDLAGKRLELLKEAAPKAGRVAILSNRTHPGESGELKETQAAAQAYKIAIQYLVTTTAEDFDRAFEAMVKEKAQAMLTFPDATTLARRTRLAEFAIKQRLPSIFGWKEYVDAGGLISYGPNLNDSYRRLAVYVDKILKGVKPTEIPVEQPTKFELVVNLKTAKQIDFVVPPNFLVRADRVIR